MHVDVYSLAPLGCRLDPEHVRNRLLLKSALIKVFLSFRKVFIATRQKGENV